MSAGEKRAAAPGPNGPARAPAGTGGAGPSTAAEDPVAIVRAALEGERAWLVGGAVRDRLAGRPTADLDLVVDGDARAAARRLGRAVRGPVFPLSETFGAWRVIAADRRWQADLMPLEPGGIEQDLARRDFTINAMAEPLAGGDLVDPFGGRDDLAARRLRMVDERAFDDDPLRVIRLARFACELDLTPTGETLAAGRARAAKAADVAPERTFGELRRIVTADRALDGLALLDELALTPVILPELSDLRGVEQSHFHHLDVHDHTLAVLEAVIELERDPEPALGEHAAGVAAVMAEPLADELTRGQALRFGALFHDVGKPATRGETPEGRVTFMGHDELGATMARAALERLRASERLRAHVAGLARHHLRLGFLVHHRPLSRRAVHAYLRACEPVEVDVTVLSVADRLATRGAKSEVAIAKHLDLARELLGEALRWRATGPPAPLVRGDELADALGIAPGPELGRLLAELEAAQFAGEVATRDEAIAHARRVLEAPEA